MTIEIVLILSIVACSMLLFILEIMPIETIGLAIMVAVVAFGLVTPEEGVSGFSNPAVVTILALMLIGAGLEETGAVQAIGYKIKGIFYLPEWQNIGLLMLIVGTVSAFINTTAVVLVFLSVLLKLSGKIPGHLSKLLIPLSFAGILGGSCSLMGTSTNLLVSSISEQAGLEPFGFFEFTPIGVGIFMVAFFYMLLIGRHFLPERRQKVHGHEGFLDKTYSTLVTVKEGSRATKMPLHKTVFYEQEDFSVIAVSRAGKAFRLPYRYEKLDVGDRLIVRASAAKIKAIMESEKLALPSEERMEDLAEESRKIVLCEALMRPNSKFIGRRMRDVDLWKNYNMIVLGIHSAKKAVDFFDSLSPKLALKKFLRDDSLEVGDSLLVLANEADVEKLSSTRDFVLLRQFRELHHDPFKMKLSLAILAGAVVLAATDVLPIMISALAGALAMTLTGCIPLSKAFRSVNWSVLFLLAGMIPLGLAMTNTGADHYLAEKFIQLLPNQTPLVAIGGLFLLTALMSGVLSNNATAILMAPVAISLAGSLGLPPKPLLFAVMFGANTSYFTPIGYQTNTLIYNPGNYRFRDFLLVGGLLTLLVVVVGTFLIHYFTFGE